MKTETLLALFRQLLPMATNGLEQVEAASDVALDKGSRAINRTVDMAFSCQMHHKVGVCLANGLICCSWISQINLQQLMA
ncbi:MAG: Uncharacterised protein [Prochlorococcus marinus str. MIT 9215]|nr:MAG: Uncharacterised protein [Prochlorococcus marinus str. MIT 9215]